MLYNTGTSCRNDNSTRSGATLAEGPEVRLVPRSPGTLRVLYGGGLKFSASRLLLNERKVGQGPRCEDNMNHVMSSLQLYWNEL